MKKFRWQILIVLVTGLIVGILLYFQQSGTNTPAASTPSPISGGIYTEALIGNFQRLNPLLDAHNAPDQDVDRLIFSSLIKFDANGLPQGDLAESWSFGSDGSVFTFSLKPNAYWHDGTPVSSQDVVYTTSLLKGGSALLPEDLKAFWAEVQVIQLSDLVVQFGLPEAFAPIMDYLSFGVLPAHLLGNLGLDELVNHPFNMAPIGSGPYKFSQLFIKDGVISGIDLVANGDYYGGRPYIDEIVFQYYPSEKPAWNAYQAGEVDGLARVSNDILPEVLGESGLNLYSTREPSLSMIFLNLNNSGKAFLQNASFRRALMLATNRQGMIDQVLLGQGIIAKGPILPGNWAYYAEQESIPYDPDAARQLIASEGMAINQTGILVTTDGVEVRLVLLTSDDDTHAQIADMIKQGWEAVGVAVDILAIPYEQVLAELDARTFDAALVDINLSGTPDPDPYPFWGASQVDTGQNYAHWVNLTASEYLEQGRVTMDIGLRTKLYRNFQVLFQEDLPSLPLFYPIYNYAVKETIKNVSIGPIYSPSDRFNAIGDWYILAGKADEAQATTAPQP